jgi:hypothetical protein
MKLISGGQTGADRGALDFAICYGLEHGGYCPAGRRAEDGEIPACYHLVELKSASYRARTQQNVAAADATVVFRKPDVRSPGSDLTVRLCAKHRKPCLVLPCQDAAADAAKLAAWLDRLAPEVLNVAGHRESSCPGITDYVYNTLALALKASKWLAGRAAVGVSE